MRSVEHTLYVVLVAVALLAAALSGCLARQGAPAPSAPPAAGQEVAGSPAPPTGETPPVSPTLPPDFQAVVVPLLTQEASWTPTPTPTSPPSTAMPTLLPRLGEGSYVAVYTAVREDGSVQLMRAEVDAAGRVVGPQYPAGPLWGARYQLEGLYPSPDGRLVAVAWVYGNGGQVGLLRASDGEFRRDVGPGMVSFLGWSPDGAQFLACRSGASAYQLYLVEAATGEYREVDVPQQGQGQEGPVYAAALSPDGRAVVVARTLNLPRGTEVWRVPLDAGSEPALLYAVRSQQISHLSFSPDGTRIAFVQWDPATQPRLFADAQLWLMGAGGDGPHPVARTVSAPYGAQPLAPAWSPDGRSLLFLVPEGEDLGQAWPELHTDLYRLDVASEEATPVTALAASSVLGPGWAPDGQTITLLGSSRPAGEFAAFTVDAQTLEIVPVDHLAVDFGGSSYGPLGVWLRVAR